MSYEYLLLLDKEVKYVWKRPWSPMSYLYLIGEDCCICLDHSAAILSFLWNGAIPHIVVLQKSFSSGVFTRYTTVQSSYFGSY
ncbi:uncharacterized protein BJ212DRAFT_1368267 [Suillus subaureus]|uniref:DUF6533 domain-containing protein n=1 Tax=Suillus subaureus TaxID=48587 RepID=A0A9P7E765_9AGAM|nr:uncharacterized protein BJ212DRAFT_1368267 [Suillus subaureus]KAG1812809.1 hypothetical protein BJ212DRAFT_1368267 [Suillus subaureus]